MLKYSIFLVCVGYLCGCTQETDTSNTLVINPTTNYSPFDLLEYVDRLEYIPLEEKEGVLLNDIKKIIKLDDAYVVQCYKRSALFFFDTEGQYLKRVVATGEGPKEFSNLMDVTYDEQENRLFLLDFHQKKVVVYDLDGDGTIQEGINLDHHAYSIAHFDSKLYLISSYSELEKVKIYSDSTFELIGSGVPTRQKGFNWVATQDNMYVYGDTLFVNVGFTDTIYYSTGNDLKPYALLGEGRTSLTSITDRSELFGRSTHPEVEKLTTPEERNVIVPVGMFSIYNNIWFNLLVWPDKVIIWNRNKNIQRYLDFKDVENRSLICTYWLFNFFDIDEEGFTYNPLMLNDAFYADAKKVVASDKYDEQLKAPIKELLEKYPEGSGYENPIIVKVRFDEAMFN